MVPFPNLIGHLPYLEHIVHILKTPCVHYRYIAVAKNTMSTFDFYSYLNTYTPELQAKALRLANGDMAFARELYQMTATRALKMPTDSCNAGNVEFFVDGIMLDAYMELATDETLPAL